MPIAHVTTGVTLEEYTEEQRLLAGAGESFPGRLAQVCFGEPDNLTVVTVYESTEDRDAFGEKVLAQLGIAARPGDRTEQLHRMSLDPVQCVQEPVRGLLDNAPWPVRRCVGALNSGDTQRLLDFFPDGVPLSHNGSVFAGRAGIREFCDREMVGANGYLDVRQVSRSGETVVVAGPYHSQRLNGPHRFVFSVKADRITALALENDPEPAWLS
jgi:hypothetical protein